MMTSYFEYIVTSLDMHSIDLEDFKFGGTNITAFRIVDPHNPEVVEVISYPTLSKTRQICFRLFVLGSSERRDFHQEYLRIQFLLSRQRRP